MIRLAEQRVYVGWCCRFCRLERVKPVSILRHCLKQHPQEMSEEQWSIPRWVFQRDQWEWKVENLSRELPDVSQRQRRSVWTP